MQLSGREARAATCHLGYHGDRRFRVPCTCPNGAYWAFLAISLLIKINKLRVINDLPESNSPLQHQPL